MKFIYSAIALLFAQCAIAAPSLRKRADAAEACSVGFCTLNGGTTGGAGGSTTTVTTLAELTAAVSGSDAKIVIIDGEITGNEVIKVGSNTSLLGTSSASLVGVGLRVINEKNVIIRNIKISKVVAPGDNVAVQASNQVWVDHMDLSSDKDHGKDFYDGLLDITHGCTGITLSNNHLHDHFKGSLVGHSDNNGDEDTAIRVSYFGNWFDSLNSRGPSFRFGQGHIFNNYYTSVSDGINIRDEGQVLVENNVWVDAKKPLYSTDGGLAVANGNDFGGAENTAGAGTISASDLGYEYTLAETSTVAAGVQASAGQTLDF
ncbi:polysaccharide lyase family 1 protein [Cylindrobasidium torrendii FP15055 ss-10]|uniref:Polysaccharide lyase family 1 protein n=1 Tax=Cylindrobasidium torrendii FP15055 ss-10 TaxID=1314674 RepID=A0A0D7BH25_9AGAR|nr:polysaccharide lyase family 1 protein [Cylindrobasidium torrendii FP15055 ss-10]